MGEPINTETIRRAVDAAREAMDAHAAQALLYGGAPFNAHPPQIVEHAGNLYAVSWPRMSDLFKMPEPALLREDFDAIKLRAFDDVCASLRVPRAVLLFGGVDYTTPAEHRPPRIPRYGRCISLRRARRYRWPKWRRGRVVDSMQPVCHLPAGAAFTKAEL